ncbi:50S ribosomal protein L18 [Patescibacteria group bacterium]|nr:50S ribosomal protein L18 [Patescibacteria group bacterium]MBU1922073.1 50S ribosomal protein L18 [Patescibacteria group bacterium]
MKDKMKQKREQAKRRRAKTRKTIRGTAKCPRLVVSRSLRHIYVQLVDDEAGKTLVGVSDALIPKKKGMDKKAVAKEVGNELAKVALAKGIDKVVFDRAGYKFHGRIREFAQAAREGGLKF